MTTTDQPPGSLVIRVQGEAPHQQGSMTIRYGKADPKTKQRRAFLAHDDSAELKRWRGKIVKAANLAIRAREGEFVPFGSDEQPVEVVVVLRLPRPASVPPGKRPLPTVRPDIDKLARAVLDALTEAVVVVDDARVVDLVARKRYDDDAPMGCTITVRAIDAALF